MEARNQLLGMAAQEPQMLTGVRPNGQEDTSQYRLYIDLEKHKLKVLRSVISTQH